jgi:hypothetical protein
MKKFQIHIPVFILLLLFALHAPLSATHAQTPISKEMADAYYGNCKNQPSPNMTPETQDLMCACTAAKMTEGMNVEDMRAMAQNNQNGRDALNKMLINVYAPCIQYPAKEHYKNTCMSNPQTKALSKTPKKLCGCMAEKVSGYLATDGQKVFQDILRRNPTIADPMSALEQDAQFQQFARSQLLSCVM